MSDWDQRFSRIVAETERHLASVKNQLQINSGSNSIPSKKILFSSSVPHLSNTAGSSSPPSILKNSGTKSFWSSDAFTSPPKRNVSFSSFGNPTPAITLLTERVRDQNKDISALKESLNNLQFFTKEQHNEIRSLKDEVHAIQMKLAEGGVSFSFGLERKLEEFKHEISQELEVQKKKMQIPSPSSKSDHVTELKLSSLEDEFYRSNIQVNEKLNSLQQELSSLKSKLGNQESKVGGVTVGLKEVERKHDKLNKLISEVQVWQKDKDAGSSRHQRTFSNQTSQIESLRRLLSSFEERIENMEDSIFLLKDNKSRTCSAVHSDPMTVSDLKFSKIKTLPLQRRKKRSHLHAGSLKHVSNSERTRALRSKTDQSLMSDNDSFLDGHSISCSLELMSDNVETSDDDSESNPDPASDLSDTLSLSNPE